MTILKAEIAKVNIGKLEIDGLMDENKEYYVAIKQLISLDLLPVNRSAKQLELYTGLDSSAFTKLQTIFNNKPVNAIKISDIERLLISLASRGDKKSQKILNDAKIAFVSPRKVASTAKNKKEKSIQLRISQELQGLMEVPCLAGRIDILTHSEIIEVKKVASWKEALGQVLVYGSYYPSHQKRIHLFGQLDSSDLSLIKNHCNAFGVIVTWQSGIK